MALRIRVPASFYTGVSSHLDNIMRQLIDALRSIIVDTRRDVVIRGIELPNAEIVIIPHGLGYAYEHVSVSPPLGPSTSGRIELLAPVEAAKSLRLRATGYGATVTVDLRVT